MSQVNYNRAIHLVASYCGSTAVLLSAHQSIGVPQPLKLFGTDDQKKKYLPLFSKGIISAFALTEPEAGSDPRNMSTTAEPTADGKYFLINGEKLWCTNGPIAGVLVVMAVTPPKIVNGKEKKQITAFIVESDMPGFEVVHRCRFMGLNGIQNGIIRFHNVKVPKENIILGEGEGLKLALMTLNTGRLTLPAASTGIGKWCLSVVRQWCTERKQWGSLIGEHETIALKLGFIASTTFAMDAINWLTSAMADDKQKDIRIEAAIAKYFCTEKSWKIIDETLQIRGGQGYEISSSLKARGMHDWPVERVLRDVRINTIIEGTSEIMNLFIAREAIDPHLSRVKPFLLSRLKGLSLLKEGLKVAKYYLLWYPALFLPRSHQVTRNAPAVLKAHIRYIDKASRKLARFAFHCMVLKGKKLESHQSILNRIVAIGVNLFVMAASCSYASHLQQKGDKDNAVVLADLYCREAKSEIEGHFRRRWNNNDKRHIKVARKLMANDFKWLENDIIK